MKTSRKILWFMLIFSVFMSFAAVASAANIRVLLGNITHTDIFVASGSYTVKGGADGTDSFTANKGDKISVKAESGSVTVSKNGERQFSGGSKAYLNEKSSELNLLKYKNVMYRGSAVFYGKGYLVNNIDIEDYLYGVVGKEMGYSKPAEALKAQAVASRSFAAYSVSSSNTYYDITSSTQVYGGYTAERAYDNTAVYNAVKATKGQYAYYDNKIIQAFFSAHAGGYTENNDNVWGSGAVPYLRAVASPYDSVGTAYNNWTVTYTPDQMKNLAESYMKKTGQSGSFGTFKELKLYYTDFGTGGSTASGRVTKAEIIGTGATVSASKNNIRTLLNLKSTMITAGGSNGSGDGVPAEVYVVNNSGNKVKSQWKDLYGIGADGIAKLLGGLSNIFVSTADRTYSGGSGGISGTVTINGKGYGHGVGMSQYGAIGMAQAGYTYDQILKHYYGGKDPAKFKLVTK
ncbi:MAG: SpoIID/LytB domain-containing protein [Bacillota bacterium]